MTPTPPPTENPVGTIGIYPNPVKTDDPIHVTLHLDSPTSDIRVTIVTAAYRKTSASNFTGPFNSGNVTLVLDLTGVKLANGLYYLVVQPSTGKHSIAKFVVLK